MADILTTISDMIDPEVMADMIDGKLTSKIVVSKFAKVDTTLSGVPGDTVTVPRFDYIGDAKDVAEGAAIEAVKLTTKSEQAKIKKVMQSVLLTDEAMLSGLGNPEGQATAQLAKSIAAKLDNDAMEALQTATYTNSATDVINYEGVVNAIDLFEEEVQSQKVMFVHPKQVTQLRLDPNFISADKYNNNVVMKGEIGEIAGTKIVPSKKVPVKNSQYVCPIVKLNEDEETEDELSAITIYMKRDTMVEKQRVAKKASTEVIANKFYTVALTNAAKVVLAKFNTTATAATE